MGYKNQLFWFPLGQKSEVFQVENLWNKIISSIPLKMVSNVKNSKLGIRISLEVKYRIKKL